MATLGTEEDLALERMLDDEPACEMELEAHTSPCGERAVALLRVQCIGPVRVLVCEPVVFDIGSGLWCECPGCDRSVRDCWTVVLL